MIRVLLCVERRSDLAITSGFLQQASVAYEVEWAHSYADALRHGADGGHHVLLVDAELGMGRGLELLHQHIASGSGVPVVLLVVTRDDAYEAAALRAGAADVLVRDEIDPRVLDRSLRHAAIRSRMGQPFGWRPGVSSILSNDDAVDLISLGVERARRNRLGCAVLAVSYDMPTSARRAAERAGASFFGALIERMRICVAPEDAIVRTDVHELLVVANGLPGPRVAAEYGGKILGALSDPFGIAGQEVRLSGQIGIATFPDHGGEAGTLLGHAREAMHSARAGERSQLRMHQASKRSREGRRADVRRLIEGAIERDEISLHYQPQVDTDDGSVVGAEALMRWSSPELGAVSPSEFIPIAEELGLIARLGEWALLEGCQQAKRWLDAGRPVRVGINVSAQQFGRSDLGKVVRHAIERSGLPPRLLELEITEGLLLENTSDTRSVLQGLRNDGVLVAVDDFGTGYASLSYVKRFPMDVIKIDREFVRGLPLDTENVAITSSIIALARSLDLEVIAEGVETEAEQEFLRSMHCPIVQGYLYAKPMEASALEAWRDATTAAAAQSESEIKDAAS